MGVAAYPRMKIDVFLQVTRLVSYCWCGRNRRENRKKLLIKFFLNIFTLLLVAFTALIVDSFDINDGLMLPTELRR